MGFIINTIFTYNIFVLSWMKIFIFADMMRARTRTFQQIKCLFARILCGHGGRIHTHAHHHMMQIIFGLNCKPTISDSIHCLFVCVHESCGHFGCFNFGKFWIVSKLCVGFNSFGCFGFQLSFFHVPELLANFLFVRGDYFHMKCVHSLL